ncbi:MAG: hypothetical protein KBC15_03145 [Candidatus Levybacteria bacterium]|nr:hypothetical protein [Candidatus Levybacteria bacterium]
MSEEINLLYNKKQVRKSQLVAKVRFLRLIAVGLLGFVSFLSVILFLLVVSSPLPAIKKQQEAIVASLSNSHDVILKQSLLNTRLSDIQEIIKNRSNFEGLITVFEKGLPKSAVITQLTVERNTVNVTFTANDLDEITKYLDGLKAKARQKQTFKEVYLVSLNALQDENFGVKAFVAELTVTLL